MNIAVLGTGMVGQAIAGRLHELESFGHDDVIDLGPLETARGTEMILPVWLRLMGALGTGAFNFKVVS
jgi:predicted dinucleotide-binding enzyme